MHVNRDCTLNVRPLACDAAPTVMKSFAKLQTNLGVFAHDWNLLFYWRLVYHQISFCCTNCELVSRFRPA